MKKIKALWFWLYEARYTFLCLSITAAALYLSLRPQAQEWTIRLTGGALQLLGVLTIVLGAIKTRSFFGLPPVHSKALAWVVRFPLLKRSVSANAAASMNIRFWGDAQGYCTHSAGEDPTIETRIASLEKNIDMIHSRISDTQRGMNEDLRGVKLALRAESEARALETRKISRTVHESNTGGLYIAVMGAVWLFFGVILSTAAIEIECILK